jgi:hypothetical protein
VSFLRLHRSAVRSSRRLLPSGIACSSRSDARPTTRSGAFRTLRREIPSGDPGLIFDRAIALLLETVEKSKRGAAAKPRRTSAIRPAADGLGDTAHRRHNPNDVKRGAERRDEGRCAFVAADGRRCTERSFLEFHHVIPYAKGGRATIDNISLRCRRHNQYEVEIVFGPRLPAGRLKHPSGRQPLAGLPPEARSWPPLTP